MYNKINESLSRAVNSLLSKQKHEGYWNYGFNSNSLATAISAVVYADYKKKSESKKAIEWLLNTRNKDGGWGDLPGANSNPDCTACGLAALKLNGYEDLKLEKMAKDIQQKTKGISPQSLVYLAYVDLISWDDIKVPPLSMISDPVMFDETKFYLSEPMVFIERFTTALVSLLKTLNLNNPYETAFIPHTFKAIKKYQHNNGSWFGYMHSTGLALLAMKNYECKMKNYALNWVLQLQKDDGGVQISEGLPVHDTAISILSLDMAGIDVGQLLKSKNWLLTSQGFNGGWGWIPFCTPPDSDDTALSILALNRYSSSPEIKAAMTKGSIWLINRQQSNGSISTFPEDYDGYVKGGKIPSISVTARALKAFLITDNMDAANQAKKFLLEILNKNYKGPEWFQGILYPMSLLIEALIEAGVDKEIFQDFLDELILMQNKDGSWGNAVKGGCVEETAFAITTLILGGNELMDTHIQKAVNYILNKQNHGGDWDSSPLGLLPPIKYENGIWTLFSIIKTLSLTLGKMEKDGLKRKI